MIQRCVLTGGPGVGKTSIIRCFQSLRYDVREEVFTSCFQKAESEGRFHFEFLHSKNLIHDLLSAQLVLEAQPTSAEVVFFDRSRVDI